MVALLALMLLAAVVDLQESRVPNWVSALLLFGGVAFCLFGIAHLSLWQVAGGVAVGLAGFLPFYAAGGMGAGDVKLMAAGGSFLGPMETMYAIAATLIIGGAGVLAVMGFHRLRQSYFGIPSPSIRKSRFPYAPCIAAGVSLVFVNQYLSVLGALR